MIVVCRRCAKCKVNRPRGLCWSCYYTPGVKELYPSTSKYARRGVGNFTGNAPLPDAPTTAAPGTPEKLAVLEQRAKLKQALFHPADAKFEGDITGVLQNQLIDGRDSVKTVGMVPYDFRNLPLEFCIQFELGAN